MSASWESLANDHILGIAPYEPGKPIEELERELGISDVIKLASNENPLAPSDRVMKAMQNALTHINRYPDGSGYYLRQAIARRHGLTSDHVILGNGSNDLIELMVRAFLRPGEEAVIPHPSFVVYPMIVQAVGGIRVVVTLKDQRLDLEAMARAITPMTKMVFIANPNNPTATIVTADEVEHFMARVPDKVIVVFDEAYIEFAQGPDFPDSLAYLKQGKKVASLRTFSKAASLAGLRVGYGVADPDCVSLLNRIRQPFNVNSVAQAAALAAHGGRLPRGGVPAHDRGGTRLPLRRVHRAEAQVRAFARQLHPGGRGPQRERRLPLAAQGRRDRAAHDELRDGERAARHHRHPRGEPAVREGAQEGPRGGQERVIRRLSLVGLGLLGGSVAKAARAQKLADEIVAVGRDRARLEPALRDGMVDRVSTSLEEGVAGADFCLLATPVATLDRAAARGVAGAARRRRCSPTWAAPRRASWKRRRRSRAPGGRSPSWAAIRWPGPSGAATPSRGRISSRARP